MKEDIEKKSFWENIAQFWCGKTKQTKIMSREEAYIKSKYPRCKNVDEYIISLRNRITDLIGTTCSRYGGSNDFDQFYCTWYFTPEETLFVDRVLEPFIEQGYTVVNLADKVKVLNKESIYLIMWNKI